MNPAIQLLGGVDFLPPQNSSSGHVPELLEDGENHGDFIWADLEEVGMVKMHPSLLEKYGKIQYCVYINLS